MSTSGDPLSDRYGRTRTSHRTRRIVFGVAAVIFLAVVAFVGVRFADQGVRYESVGYEHTSKTSITLTFNTSMPPGTTAHCTVQALNSNRGQVGFTEVDVPAQEQSITTHRIEISTQQPAVSAEVMECTTT